MISSSSEGLTQAVRRFQWFYARHVRAPHELVEHNALSLTEMRVLFAILHAGTSTAADISRALGLDTGYLSRMLTQFERSGLIERRPFSGDARSNHVSLTAIGETGLAAASAHVRDDVSATLDAMTPGQRAQLIESMERIQRLLSPNNDSPQVRLRGPRPGDFGWIVERETRLAPGAMHAQERETCTAMEIADYLTAPEPLRNACWIAEQDGVSVGASVLIAESGQSARIAVLFVVPGARRGGAGRQLIEACVTFADESGYDRIVCGSDLSSDHITALLRPFGFEKRRDETGWEKRLKESGAVKRD